MKKLFWFFLCAMVLATMAGCESGDTDALKQAVRAADLDIVSITVQPADGTIKTGYSYPFTARGTRGDGSTVDITNSVVWSSSDSSVAAVGNNGTVTTASDGVVTISAALSALSGNTSLTASSEPLNSIQVTAASAGSLSVSSCGQLQLKAIGTYADGVRDIIPITRFVNWSIASGAADIDSLGLVTATSDGTTTDGSVIVVAASLDTQSTNTNIDIAPDLASITITPAASRIEIGDTLQFTATGNYNDSSTANITAGVSWFSSGTTIGDFEVGNPKGLLTGISAGSVTITAECGSVTGDTTLTVSEEILDYLRFEDANNELESIINIAVGDIVAIELVAHFTDGSSRIVTENTQWSTINNTGTIITVDNSTGDKGIITGLSPGTGIIEAVYGQREKVLIVNVN